jgi:hypothetical protein
MFNTSMLSPVVCLKAGSCLTFGACFLRFIGQGIFG